MTAPIHSGQLLAARILSEDARRHMTRADRVDEGWAKSKGLLKPHESYGYRAIFRNTLNGSLFDNDVIYPTRADALEHAHTAVVPRCVFERIERVSTIFRDDDHMATPRVTAGMV